MLPHDNDSVRYKLALGPSLLRASILAIDVFPGYNVVLISWDAVSKRGTCCPAYPCEVKPEAVTVLQYYPAIYVISFGFFLFFKLTIYEP